MKRFLSLLVVILTVSMFGFTTLAANIIAPEGAGVEVILTDGDVVKAEVYLVGPLESIAGFSIKIQYDKNNLTPSNSEGEKATVVSLSKNSDSSTNGDSFFSPSALYFKTEGGFAWTYGVNPLSTPANTAYSLYYEAAKTSSPGLTLTNGEKSKLGTFYLVKNDGYKLVENSLYFTSTNQLKSSVTLFSGDVITTYATTGEKDINAFKVTTPEDEPEVPGVDNGGKSTEEGEGNTPKAVTVTGKTNYFAGAEVEIGVGAVLYQGESLEEALEADGGFVKYFPAYDLTEGTSWSNEASDENGKIALWGKKNGWFSVTLTGVNESKLNAGAYKIAAYQFVNDVYKEVQGTQVDIEIEEVDE
jgi:hypothetical protein